MAHSWNPRTAARFDRYLDALATGSKADRTGIDPALTATATRLFGAANPGNPHPGRVARRRTAVDGTRIGDPVRSRALVTTGLARSFSAATTVALATVMLLGVAVTISQSARHATVSDEQHLYRWTATGAVELDPATLADRETLTFPSDPAGGSASWQVSDDGSTVLETIYAQNASETYNYAPSPTVYRVFDAASGTQRSTITDDNGGDARLSPDGRFLVVMLYPFMKVGPGPQALADNPGPRWFVYDTADGRLVKIVTPDGRWPTLSPEFTVTADGTKLIALLADPASSTPGPWPARLVEFDLQTGQQIGRLDLAEVQIGWWTSGSITLYGDCQVDANGTPTTTAFTTDTTAGVMPALAVAPDGRTLALVHASDDAVTLVDLGQMRTVATLPLTLTRATSEVADRCASDESRARWARYSADGRTLYVSGFDRKLGTQGSVIFGDLGVVRVDTESGSVSPLVQSVAAEPISRTVQLVDANRLLVTTETMRSFFTTDPNTTTVQLVSAATGEVLAQRDFSARAYISTSPIAIEPARELASPVAMPPGTMTVHLRAAGESVRSVRVVADGEVVFDGELPWNTSTQRITARQIEITSSNPGYTIVAIEGQPEVLMLAETETFPKGDVATPAP